MTLFDGWLWTTYEAESQLNNFLATHFFRKCSQLVIYYSL